MTRQPPFVIRHSSFVIGHSIERIARCYQGRWVQGYVRGKLRSDPVYAAGLALLKDSPLPVLDIGCGLGLFACWLRESGCAAPIHGSDFDAEKIAKARCATADYGGITFHVGDVVECAEQRGNVVIFDVLHYLAPDRQRALLARAADLVPAGGCCLIRATVRDGSWRFAVTRIEEWGMRAVRWMKSGAAHYPTRGDVCGPFRARGFACEVRPLWGRTPFNSYLFVFRPQTPAA